MVFVVLFGGMFMLMGGIFALVAGILVVFNLYYVAQRLKLLAKFERMTFHAYKQAHPEHVSPRGVSCFSCGGGRVQARGLMNHTYHREHFCPLCGTTLYYSPEA